MARVAPGFVWIGASRVSGRWQWSDGSPWHYTNWAHGEPSNEMYVAMTWGGDFGLWYTFGNNGKPMGSQYYTPGFVCQYDGNGGVGGRYKNKMQNIKGTEYGPHLVGFKVLPSPSKVHLRILILGCSSDTDCQAPRPTCDTLSRTCVGCTDEGRRCRHPRPICHQLSGLCIEGGMT